MPIQEEFCHCEDPGLDPGDEAIWENSEIAVLRCRRRRALSRDPSYPLRLLVLWPRFS